MIREADDGIWLELEETIASHHDEVFACLTTAEGLTRWYPVAAEVDLRKGGEIVLCWDDKCTRTLTVPILDYDPDGRIVWDWIVDRIDAHIPVTWRVKPSVEEGSRVQLRQGPFMRDTESLIAMAEEAASWRWHLCNLRSTLEVKHDMRKVRPL
ncbi:MAG TPA: SRPBCC domain-containing protein [Phycisphaerales bacterium]|nr:SRPBCC domain-containing protein [Phycisphaerales bacterium]HRQ74464.1 SRPBCC domain-containing protein [Phycisphaerales bacterium]